MVLLSVFHPQKSPADNQDKYHIRLVYAEPVHFDESHDRDMGPLPATGCEWAVGCSQKMYTIQHQVEQEGRPEHPSSVEATIQGYATMPKLAL
ncbi:hypothetical protein M9H77_29487 [Catharanthus roseus]|uniref:Uncharacterized protein n=1 Tax=Catharanthus roseus TaxID=4058 RepID=A0ACB9ZUJ9_CATRO|nr:hypothetical protein M9H77_29487 [Catharanthus roseus]